MSEFIFFCITFTTHHIECHQMTIFDHSQHYFVFSIISWLTHASSMLDGSIWVGWTYQVCGFGDVLGHATFPFCLLWWVLHRPKCLDKSHSLWLGCVELVTFWVMLLDWTSVSWCVVMSGIWEIFSLDDLWVRSGSGWLTAWEWC